jgi:hypothetical protein
MEFAILIMFCLIGGLIVGRLDKIIATLEALKKDAGQ